MNPAALVPLLAFPVVFLALYQADRDEGRVFLRTCLLWGVYAVVVTEALSLVHGVGEASLLLAWALPCGAGGLALAARARRGPLALPHFAVPRSGVGRLAAGWVAVSLGATVIVAWLAPPNTWDALNYHMSRVAQWAQNGSIAHYASGNEVQNLMPPAASIFSLQLYVLSQGDRLVNLVQWFAMVGSLVAVARIAGALGAGELGRWSAAAFAVTLPAGVVQATAVTTDYVVALWVALAAMHALEIGRGSAPPSSLLELGGAAGLAALTKQTALPFLAPLGLALLPALRDRRRRPSVLAWGGAGLIVLGLLNSGHLLRNQATYGSPMGPGSRWEAQANQILDVRVLASNFVRNATLHLGTPSPHLNKAMALAVLWFHDLIDLDANDPRTTAEGDFRVKPPSLHETRAGNLLHAGLLLGFAALVVWRRRRWTEEARYGLMVGLGFLLLGATLQWKPTGARYHLPFFILAAPWFGRMLETIPSKTLTGLAVAGLAIYSVPWLVGNPSRPLVEGWPGADTGSVLRVPRQDLLLVNAPYLAKPFAEMTEMILRVDCGSVGIALPGSGVEYQIWSMLGAPRNDLEIQWLVGGTASARYIDPEFRPCAVVCEKCPPGWERVRGLPEAYRYGTFRLFLDPGPD